MKRVASPGSMHDIGCLGLVHWATQRDGMGREEGGGFRMARSLHDQSRDQCMISHVIGV